jgi:hypothetical protein
MPSRVPAAGSSSSTRNLPGWSLASCTPPVAPLLRRNDRLERPADTAHEAKAPVADRLDLDDTALMAAKERGVGIVASTDAHSVEDLEHWEYAVCQARPAGQEARDVADTRTGGCATAVPSISFRCRLPCGSTSCTISPRTPIVGSGWRPPRRLAVAARVATARCFGSIRVRPCFPASCRPRESE